MQITQFRPKNFNFTEIETTLITLPAPPLKRAHKQNVNSDASVYLDNPDWWCIHWYDMNSMDNKKAFQ